MEKTGKKTDCLFLSIYHIFLYYLSMHVFGNSDYDQEIPQSQTADKPMTLQGKATQQSQDTRKTN